MANKVQTGANVICLLNGQVAGFVTGLGYQLGSPRAKNRGLDSMIPFELAATTTDITGSISILMLREDEGLEGRAITAGLPYVDQEQYFTLELQDRFSGFSILKVEFAAVEMVNYNIVSKSMAVGSFTFSGITALGHFTQK